MTALLFATETAVAVPAPQASSFSGDVSGAGPSGGSEHTLTLIYSANLPDISVPQAGLPELAGLLDRARARGPVAFLFGGDSLGPSIMGALDRGAHLIDVLNLLEPDALGVSKREFIFHEDELSLRAAEASFPLLSANVEDPLTGANLEGLEDSVLIRRGGMTLGVFALLGTEVMHAYPPKRVTLKSYPDVLRDMSASLRKRGADKVIVMADFTPKDAQAYVDEGVIDVLLVNTSEKNALMPTRRGIFAYYEDNGRCALEIRFSPDRAVFQPLKGEAPSPGAKAKVDSYLSHLDKLLNSPLGVTTTPLDTGRTAVRTAENAFGNFVADSVRLAMGADVALINGGVIRGDRQYDAGQTLVRRDIRTELPFHDETVLVEVSGKAIRAALENGLSRVADISGRFLHVSGLKVVYDPSAPVGRRVLTISMGGKTFSDDKLYKLATTNYIFVGGDGYDMLGGNLLSFSPVLLGDVVAQHVLEMGSIAPVIDLRLLKVQGATTVQDASRPDSPGQQ